MKVHRKGLSLSDFAPFSFQHIFITVSKIEILVLHGLINS